MDEDPGSGRAIEKEEALKQRLAIFCEQNHLLKLMIYLSFAQDAFLRSSLGGPSPTGMTFVRAGALAGMRLQRSGTQPTQGVHRPEAISEENRMKLKIVAPRSRNPLVALAHMRRAGSHRPSEHAVRRQAARCLQRELKEMMLPLP